MAAKTPTTANATYYIVKAVAYGMFALGLGLSVTHIFDFFRTNLGSTLATALAVPAFLDGMQLVGRLIRGESFAAETRKAGKWLQGFGALASLTANVVAGHSVGDKIGGVIFVIGYIVIEAIAEKIRPAADDTSTIAEREAAAKKQAAADRARRAAATRAANKAEKERKEAERKERERLNRMAKRVEIKALNAQFAAAAAPVSPAPFSYDDAPYI